MSAIVFFAFCLKKSRNVVVVVIVVVLVFPSNVFVQTPGVLWYTYMCCTYRIYISNSAHLFMYTLDPNLFTGLPRIRGIDPGMPVVWVTVYAP